MKLSVSLRKTNKAGIDLIKRFEGLRLRSYLCPAGVWTIGYGHTKTAKPVMKITEEQAEELLHQDLIGFENAVNAMVKPKLTDNQFAALVSFAYNVGNANLRKSSVLRLINEGRLAEGAAALRRWNKAGGKVLPGLIRRREAEIELFNRKS
jgi:lysozyme